MRIYVDVETPEPGPDMLWRVGIADLDETSMEEDWSKFLSKVVDGLECRVWYNSVKDWHSPDDAGLYARIFVPWEKKEVVLALIQRALWR